MAIDYLSSIDFNGIPAKAFAVPVAASDPTGYVGGVYYNTTSNEFRYWDEGQTKWITLGEAGSGGPPSGPAGGDLAGSYPNPTIAPGAIVDADVSATAAIQQSKIANLPADLNAKADTSTAITAGSGLTGGGDLSASRTINVGGGTGITVSADSIALNTAYTDGRYDAAGTAAAEVASHEALPDPHGQYLEPTEVIAGTDIDVDTTTTPGSVIINSTATGVTDHGALTGLADDDHPQYHTNARGDARYYTQGQVDSSLALKVSKSGDSMTGNLSMTANKVVNLPGTGATLSDTDAAPVWYVDERASGIDPHASARVIARDPITLSGLQTIDGVSVQAGDRVVVANQHNGSTTPGSATANGIYVAASGSWTRATDANATDELTTGSFVQIEEGTDWAGTGWLAYIPKSQLPWTPGTDDAYFALFHVKPEVQAGDALVKTANRLDVVAGTGLSTTEDDISVDRTTTDTWYDPSGAAASAVSGHEAAPDPHTQYHTDARGDARYYTKSQVDSSLAGKANTTTSIVAGNGLTGGGTLAANRTINVVGDANLSVTADQVSVLSAPKWATARTLSLIGDVTGSVNIDGSSNVSLAATVVGGSTLAQHFAGNVPAGAAPVVTHSLGTRDVTVQVYRNAAPYDTVFCDVERTSTTTVTLRFASAVAANDYRVVVQGR